MKRRRRPPLASPARAPASRRVRDGGFRIGDSEREKERALAPLRGELCDGPLFGGGPDELEMGVAREHEGVLDAEGVVLTAQVRVEGEAEVALVGGGGGGNVPDDDTDVVDALRQGVVARADVHLLDGGGVLDEDAVIRPGVEEADHAGEPGTGRFVDELDAGLGGGAKVGAAVVGLEADVVHALSTAFEEARDAGVLTGRLEELDLGGAAGEEDAADALVLDDAVDADGQGRARRGRSRAHRRRCGRRCLRGGPC